MLDQYGVAYDGEAVRDDHAVHLDGLVNGFARAGTSSTLGPPRFVITHPTVRDAAKVETDNAGPFIWMYGLVTGNATGLSDQLRVSVDGGPPRAVNAQPIFDSRKFQVRATTEGLHQVRTWRVTAAGAIAPGSEMTFQYAVGALTDRQPPR